VSIPIPSSNSSVIYLDESGDLGWEFTAPYGKGGSSRYLTIAAVYAPPAKIHLLDSVLREMSQKYKWKPGKERKCNQLSPNQRAEFAAKAKALCDANPDIHIHVIVVKKLNVQHHIRADGNKLYNFMIKLALIKKMATHDVVTLIPDPRSLKLESGNSLHDYLQTELWFTKKAVTLLISKPQDSSQCRGIQFADMVCGIVQDKYEDNDSKAYKLLAPRIKLISLFFSASINSNQVSDLILPLASPPVLATTRKIETKIPVKPKTKLTKTKQGQ
jgi:hypothetical protein